MAEWNRHDIVEAWYLWLGTHHAGIVSGSREDPRGRRHPGYWQSYNRLSWLCKDLNFIPAPGLSLEGLTENGREIYDNLCRRAGWCQCLAPIITFPVLPANDNHP